MYGYGYESFGIVAFLSSLLIPVVIAVIAVVIMYVAYWKIFAKAGEEGWKALIPIYNGYVMYKLFWNVKMFIVSLVLGVAGGLFYSIGISMMVNAVAEAYLGYGGGSSGGGIAVILLGILCFIALFVLYVIFCHKLSTSFGQSTGFTVGLVLLPVVFLCILAFGEAKYVGGADNSQDDDDEDLGYIR